MTIHLSLVIWLPLIGAVGVVRAGTSFARAIQTGYLRAYALLLVMGVLALGLYFLLVSS